MGWYQKHNSYPFADGSSVIQYNSKFSCPLPHLKGDQGWRCNGAGRQVLTPNMGLFMIKGIEFDMNVPNALMCTNNACQDPNAMGAGCTTMNYIKNIADNG